MTDLSQVHKTDSVSDTTFVEQFTEDEKKRIEPFFTNLDNNVFALKNLPKSLEAALFVRYSRTHLGARRLLLEQYMEDKDVLALIEIYSQIKEPQLFKSK